MFCIIELDKGESNISVVARNGNILLCCDSYVSYQSTQSSQYRYYAMSFLVVPLSNGCLLTIKWRFVKKIRGVYFTYIFWKTDFRHACVLHYAIWCKKVERRRIIPNCLYTGLYAILYNNRLPTKDLFWIKDLWLW